MIITSVPRRTKMAQIEPTIEAANRWLSRKPQTYSSAAELAAFDIIYDLTMAVTEQAAALASAQQTILRANTKEPSPLRGVLAR